MVLYHKDFSKEAMEMEDFWRVFGVDDETAKSGNVEKIEDEEIVTINRSKMGAMLMAEEMNAKLTIEEENGELRIIISKKK